MTTTAQAPPRRSGRPPGFGRPLIATTIRVDPEVYRRGVLAAERADISLARWVERAMDEQARRESGE